MEQTTTIQISVYDWGKMEERVYEARVGSIAELVALSYQFNKNAKYKKSTDKNWYYCKTMIKRLFKKELSTKQPKIKFVTTNDLNKIQEEKRKAEEEARLEKEKIELEWEKWRMAHPDCTIEQINSMSEAELENRLTGLYIEDYYIGKTDYNSYSGPFESNLTEISYIELKATSELADRAYYRAMKTLCGGELTFEPDRIPKSKIFRLTDDYKLVHIGRAS